MNNEFSNTGFDPFQHLVRLTETVEKLVDTHNELARSHLRLQQQVLEQQKIITELCQRIVNAQA